MILGSGFDDWMVLKEMAVLVAVITRLLQWWSGGHGNGRSRWWWWVKVAVAVVGFLWRDVVMMDLWHQRNGMV